MDTDKQIQEIFNSYILAAHEKLAGKADVFGLQTSKEASTYFERPRHPDQLAYQILDMEQAGDLRSQLEQMWKGDEDLEAMIAPLAELAAELRKGSGEQAVELSSFIYVMY